MTTNTLSSIVITFDRDGNAGLFGAWRRRQVSPSSESLAFSRRVEEVRVLKMPS
jgi:hypothetical protein